MNIAPELCFNLWYYLNPDQTIRALAAKAYFLEGSDEEKGTLLRSLSQHDYKAVSSHEPSAKLKERYKSGVLCSALKDFGIDLVYEEIFEKIARDMPNNMPFPEEKLFFATPLYDFGEGFVPAEIGDGFIKDRD